jgi:toluene monooxygenase system ferredoxin subunit
MCEKVADLDELWIGELRAVWVAGKRVALLRLEHGVHAYEDRCPHLGFPLSEGRLDGSELTCAAHGWVFDASTGLGKNPQDCRLRSLPVRVEGTSVLVYGERRE